MGTKTIVLGLLVAAAGVTAWLVLDVPDDQTTTSTPPVTPSSEGETERESEPERATLQTPGEPPRETLPTEALPQPEIESRSALARELDEVGSTFLGEDPRVAELLELLGALASAAKVDPASVVVLRGADGLPRSARGKLRAADLDGSFLIEDGVFHVDFPATTGGGIWAARNLRLSFGKAYGSATGCRAVVGFQPNPAETPADHLRAGEERLTGWTIFVTPEHGAELRPTTVAGAGDEWLIGSRREAEVRALPWISNTSSFDAWLRVLEPHSGE